MKRQEFIAQLLRDDDSECMICREEYGTTSLETGIVERRIHLPCDPRHTVGSNCIEIWLQAHNTCPVCRQEFFSVDENESTVIEDDEDDQWSDGWGDEDDEDDESQDEDQGEDEDLRLIFRECRLLCSVLSFESQNQQPILDIARLVASCIWSDETIQQETIQTMRWRNYSIAAASVYTATYMVGQRRSIEDIARVCPARVASIRTVYRLIRDAWPIPMEGHDSLRRVGINEYWDAWALLPRD